MRPGIRPLSALAMLIAISMAMVACTGSSDQGGSNGPSTVRASAFELTDEQGGVRASLELDQGEPAFRLNDAGGTGRLEIRLTAGGDPVVNLFDKTGVRRAGFEFANGEHPALFLRDNEGRLKAGMQVQSGGNPHLFLRNEALEDGFAVTLVDGDLPVMALSDHTGSSRAFLGLEESNFDGSLVFVAQDGSIAFKVP